MQLNRDSLNPKWRDRAGSVARHRHVCDTGTAKSTRSGGVSVVVLTYNTDPLLLDSCVGSVLASEGIDSFEVVIADNGSSVTPVRNPLWPAHVAVRIVRLGKNHGFAEGTNQAIRRCKSSNDLLFFLNADAIVEPTAIAECERVMRAAGPSTMSVAPKMLLALGAEFADLRLIDTVGNAVNSKGEGTNIGLGQPDVGQFDTPAPCFGPCFGASMFRREAFSRDNVGPLVKTLFLYYEDVEWSWRAQHLGFDCVSAPQAIVWHRMSMHVRHLGYGFKVRFLERNLLLMTAMHRSPRAATGIWRRRFPQLFTNARNGHFPAESLHAAIGALVHLPEALLMRNRVRRRRQRTDSEILCYPDGERTFFDHLTYTPQIGLDAFVHAYARRARVCDDQSAARIAEAASMLTAEKDRPFSVAVALESLMMNQPLAALAYLRLIDTQRSKSADDTGEKSHPSELSPHG